MVWGKSCLSVTEEVLETDILKVFLAGYCFRLCLRMRKIFSVLINMLHTSADVLDSVLFDCTWLNQSTAREGKSKQEIKQ